MKIENLQWEQILPHMSEISVEVQVYEHIRYNANSIILVQSKFSSGVNVYLLQYG